MRSDRDIQRTPRRPVRTEGNTDTPKPEQAADAPFANIPVSHREPTGAPYSGERRPTPRPHHRPDQRPEPWGQQPPQRSQRPGPAFREDRQDDRRRVAPPQGEREATFRRDDSRPPVRIPRSTEGSQGRAAPHPEGVRLSKVLADRGVSSRREADDWSAAGWVKVDGVMAELGQRVLPTARIDIDPAAHQQQAQRVTILLNKPIGYVSGQAEDGYEPASVLVTAAKRWEEDPVRRPFHPGHARGLAPAGRLDIDSTGLLVLTQDGRIAKHLIGEDSTVEKEYWVRVEYQREGAFPENDLKRLNHGLELDGVQLRPARVSWANEDQLRFVLREGRKRQIRRMCELVGLKVVGLKRVRIGSVVLGKLPVGQWRYLRDDERF